MAWSRDQSSSFISGSSIYAYTEVDWNVGASRCTYTHIGGVTSPYYWDTSATGTLFWREWSGGAWGAWHEYASGTAHFGGYGDKELVRTDDFFARQAADREVQLACDVTAAGGTGSAWLTYTVPHLPNAPASITATRVSDNQVTVSWTAPTRSYDAMCLEVSIDGGSWSEFAQLWNASTSTTYSQASADHSYRFRARAYYQSAYSDYTSPTAAVAMTPSAPQSISTAAAGGTNIDVTLDNPSPVATKVQYQISTDGGANWGAVTDSPSLTSFSISASGTVRVRVRNYNATGESAWLESGDIVTICPPAAPTLLSPSSNVINMSDGSVTFEWVHNALDGSSQTAAQLDYEDLDYEDASDTKTIVGDAQSYNQPISDEFSVGDRIKWRMRTKGADASYGEWSGYKTFTFYTAPTLSITSPSATVTGMPISLAATYSDMAGFTCQAATVSLQKDGRTLFSENATISGSSITASLTTDEFLPTNGETYTVVLTARSSSGLSTSANATFTVDFVEPQAGELSIANDPETGYASLLATFDNSASEITYTGSTNAQHESSEGYVRSLTVEGKSEVQSGSLVSIEGVGVRGRNLADLSGMAVVSGGVTYTTDGSSITLSGTSGGSEWSTASGIAYIPVEPNTAYTISLSDKPSDLFNGFYISFWEVDESKANVVETLFATWSTQHDVTEKTLTTRSNTRYLKVRCGARYANTATNVTVDVQIELGSTAHAYEPYSLTTITTPLRSAGSVHDTLMADADSWTVGRKVGYVDLGSLTWSAGTTNTTGAYRMYSTPTNIKPASSNSSVGNVLCAAYTSVTAGNTWARIEGVSVGTDGRVYIYDPNYNTSSSPSAFKTAMSGVYLFYELATPTTDTETSMSRIEIGSAFTVATDLDSTFEMTTWDGSADAVSISVSRVNADGTITPLLTDGASGSGLVDRYAPLNTKYQYAVTTTADTQAVKTVYVDNELVTDLWFVYWGDNIASAKWNPDNGGIQVTRPQKTRVYYAGRRDPVSYDGHAVSLTETPSWTFLGKDEVDTFVGLIEDGGRGVYKSCDGWVYHADFDLTMTPSYTAIGYYGGASLGITRIAGEKL